MNKYVKRNLAVYKIDTFLERHKLQKSNQEEIDSMTSPMAVKEIKLVK